jgi:hypothetical protein
MSRWLVTPYTHPDSEQPENGQFNCYHSKARVRCEHAIGWLKGRFQSLRELRLTLKNEKHIDYAIQWIQTCIVLHNFCLDWEDKMYEVDDFFVEGFAAEQAMRQTRRYVGENREDGGSQRAVAVAGTRQRERELAEAKEFREDLKGSLRYALDEYWE